MKFKIVCSLLLFIMLYACDNSYHNDTALRQEVAKLKERIKALETLPQDIEAGKIKHTVMFSLKHRPDAPETTKFLQDGKRILTAIPGVKNFRIFHQVSPKNEYHFCFSMEFADKAAYQAYNEHPEHVKFVKERWDTEVSKFLEGDFEDFQWRMLYSCLTLVPG